MQKRLQRVKQGLETYRVSSIRELRYQLRK